MHALLPLAPFPQLCYTAKRNADALAQQVACGGSAGQLSWHEMKAMENARFSWGGTSMHDLSYRRDSTTDQDDPARLPASFPQAAERPLVRVYTLGPLTLEWVGVPEPFPGERLHGRGAAPALALLKALVSRPHRYAARDWLCEALRSAEEEALSYERLHDLATLLRGLLCPPMADTERRDHLRRQLLAFVHSATESGPGYRLGAYPLIWVDIDALAWNVEQACRMIRFGDDPLPFWERAYALARRGEYLLDESYSDWAEPRRAEAARYLRQSVHALAQLYLTRDGERGEEEALRLLGDYWEQHVTDEDALRPLMELLGKRERYQEALSSYQRLCAVLEEEDRTPDAHTTDLKEFLGVKQLQRTRTPQLSGSGRLLAEAPQADLLPLFSQAVTQGILQAVGELEGVRPLHLSDPITRRMLIAHFLGLSPALLLDWRSLSTDYHECTPCFCSSFSTV
jgi:DNA-binding SARP family transcriptional activator